MKDARKLWQSPITKLWYYLGPDGPRPVMALKLGAKAHRRLAEARAADRRGGDRIALRLFSTRVRALVRLLREVPS